MNSLSRHFPRAAAGGATAGGGATGAGAPDPALQREKAAPAPVSVGVEPMPRRATIVRDPVNETLAVELMRRQSEGVSKTGLHRRIWDECAYYCDPRKRNGIMGERSPGAEQTMQIHDTTALDALTVFAAGLASALTPSSEQWFSLQPMAADEGNEEYKHWLSLCSETMFQELNASNFNLEIWNSFVDFGCFGLAGQYIEELHDDSEARVNFSQMPVGSWCIEEGRKGDIVGYYEKRKMTALAIWQQWGEDGQASLHEDIWKAVFENEGRDRQKEFELVHAVYPRVSRRDGRATKRGPALGADRPYADVWVDMAQKSVVIEGGFFEKPFAAGRFYRANNEQYGRCPADAALPEIRYVNGMDSAICVHVEQVLDPTLMVPDTFDGRLTTRPGGRNYYQVDLGADSITPMKRQQADLGVIAALVKEKRDVIRRHFFTDIFEMFTATDERQRQKTATEVAAMNREKLARFTPLFMRISTEFLPSILKRVFLILLRQGVFGDASLVEKFASTTTGAFRIDYQSKLAIAIKAVQKAGILEAMQITTDAATLDPNVRYVVNWEDAVRAAVANAGVPARLIRTKAEVAKLVADEARMQNAQAAMATAKDASAAVKNLGPEAQAAVTPQIVPQLQSQGGVE